MTDDTQPTDDSAFLAKAGAAKRAATGGKKVRAGKARTHEDTAVAPLPSVRNVFDHRPQRGEVAPMHDAIGGSVVDLQSPEYETAYQDAVLKLEAATGRPITAPDRMLIAAQTILREKFGVKDFHPVVELMVIGGDRRYHPDIRVRALGRAAPFVVPTLKSIEISGNEEKPVVMITDTEMQERMARKLGLILEGEVLEDILNPEDDNESE